MEITLRSPIGVTTEQGCIFYQKNPHNAKIPDDDQDVEKKKNYPHKGKLFNIKPKFPPNNAFS